MRISHFEALRPVCPRCLYDGAGAPPLVIAAVDTRTQDRILSGVLHCSNRDCQLEFLILDGVPVIVPDVRGYLRDQINALTARADLSPTAASILGDATGPGSDYDTRRQHLSIYAWDAYGEYDDAPNSFAVPGAATRCLQAGLALCQDLAGPVVDLGCGTGRTTFELGAATEALVLGVDLNFAMLRLAQAVLNDGMARYPLRRAGVVYDERRVQTPLAGRMNVDFWACDALRLPFEQQRFGTAVALNLLDCVPDPRRLLDAMGACLQPGGQALVACPYDWAPSATPIEGWLGGHSQRGPLAGEPAAIVRALLTPTETNADPTLRIRGEIENLPWHARLHDRSVVSYALHLLALQRTAEPAD